MRILLPLLPLVAFATLGCSSTPPTGGEAVASRTEELNDVAGLLRMSSGPGGKGPGKVQDLAKFESGYPAGYAAIKSGDIVVVWGVTMGGEGDTGTEEVVAYDKKVPTDGGMVLLVNGKVKQMTAAEFAAAPKAKK
jgi:hypothetical protein